MLVSSVQAVVACYATAPRVCTLVLFIVIVFIVLESNATYMYMYMATTYGTKVCITS